VHCVRAMNILNPEYFPTDLTRQIFKNMVEATEVGGILAVGSNEGPGSSTDGAIYLRRADGLLELSTFGDGFRCRDRVADFIKEAG